MYNIPSVLYIADLRSPGDHDFVMLSLWENIQIASLPKKKLEIFASLHGFCVSIPQYVTIRDYVFLSWVYLSKHGVKSGQMRSSDVSANNLAQNKDRASKMVPLGSS